ncbi:MAG: S8 family serine peptidase [Bacteroidia bacterium]
MKSVISLSLLFSLFFGFFQQATAQKQPPKRLMMHEKDPNAIKDQYMVVFTKEAFKTIDSQANFKNLKSREAKRKALKQYEAKFKPFAYQTLEQAGISKSKIVKVFSGKLNGFVIKLTKTELNLLLKIKRIWWIERDLKFKYTLKPGIIKPFSTQKVDWGVDKVGSKSGVGKCAFILDTGIDLDHPDLNVSNSLSISYVSAEPSADDLNGHGTHCAGIIGAKDNLIGTKGVAAGATVVAVKVLGQNGTGTYSDVSIGVLYSAVVGVPGDVMNLSLSGAGYFFTLDFYLTSFVASSGMYATIAAGNNDDHAKDYMPARVNGSKIYTISNHDSNDDLTATSNYGNGPVDYAAPGQSIYSTDIGGTYSTRSGTSMSAPHVAGIILVNNGTIRNRGTVSTDKDTTKDKMASVN